jgi:2-oxoglutarate-Fe(II)-dependent oxygenase superfamily protein
LPTFLPKDLLEAVGREVDRGAFYERTHSGIDDNKELCMRTNTVAAGLLHVLLNSEELFDLVERVTGCGRIGCFRGRVYRVVPGCGHRDAWHSDVARHRLVAMSINLSRRPYRGGVLQLRAAKSRRILRDVPNLGYGDAILFRIADGLEHRITDIEGNTPKTAFAGWFHSRPSFKKIVEGSHVRRA